MYSALFVLLFNGCQKSSGRPDYTVFGGWVAKYEIKNTSEGVEVKTITAKIDKENKIILSLQEYNQFGELVSAEAYYRVSKRVYSLNKNKLNQYSKSKRLKKEEECTSPVGNILKDTLAEEINKKTTGKPEKDMDQEFEDDVSFSFLQSDKNNLEIKLNYLNSKTAGDSDTKSIKFKRASVIDMYFLEFLPCSDHSIMKKIFSLNSEEQVQ